MKHPRVAVIGSGALGTISALALTRKGFEVSLFERNPKLWNSTSRVGEGKIHLGLIYILGDEETREFILRGALSFSAIIDELTTSPVNWSEIASEPFTYLVMPDSILSLEQVQAGYRQHDELFQRLSAEVGSTYLGVSLERLVEPDLREHPLTGLASFQTHERAVNPNALRDVLLAELDASTLVAVHTSSPVVAVENVETGVKVSWQADGVLHEETFDAVVNAAWENQASFVSDQSVMGDNIRYKTALIIPRDLVDDAFCDTVTMVIGPYGDMVMHDDYLYLSWYPVARVGQESSTLPSDEMKAAVERALRDSSQVHAQLDVFRGLGFFGENAVFDDERVIMKGGFIMAEGKHDIHRLDSGLHSRPERALIQEGKVFTPLNYKFTTAPMMAKRVAELIDEGMTR